MSEEKKKTCSYDEIPYPSSAFPQTHPRSLATVATLLGMTPPAIETCRLLEIGCAAGDNLIPMAAQFPQARFVGIDLSERQVTDANERISALGISNIEIRQLDIREAKAEDLGEFDYVISHGVYSWVPREAADRIMGIASEVLVPNGVVYISYNTLPGWHMRGMIRDMMLHHVEDVATLDRVGKARSLLQFLASCNSPQRSAFGSLLHNELRILQNTGDSYLFHEHLEPDNEPIYFNEFVRRAETAGLQYLADSQLAGTAFVMHGVPPKIRQTVEKFAGTLIEREQYIDFLRNRTFRQTLLCKAEIDVERTVEPSDLDKFYLACPHDPDNAPVPQAKVDGDGKNQEQQDASTEETEAEMAQLMAPAGKTAAQAQAMRAGNLAILHDPMVRASLKVLNSVWPAGLPYQELCTRAEEVASEEREVEDHSRELLGKRLLDLYLRGALELSPIPWVAPPRLDETTSPSVHPLTRIEVQKSEKGLVTNQRHKPLKLTEFEKRLVDVLDGEHQLDQIIDRMHELVETEELALSPSDMTQVAEREPREGIAVLVDRSLKRLRVRHVLVGAS